MLLDEVTKILKGEAERACAKVQALPESETGEVMNVSGYACLFKGSEDSKPEHLGSRTHEKTFYLENFDKDFDDLLECFILDLKECFGKCSDYGHIRVDISFFHPDFDESFGDIFFKFPYVGGEDITKRLKSKIINNIKVQIAVQKAILKAEDKLKKSNKDLEDYYDKILSPHIEDEDEGY